MKGAPIDKALCEYLKKYRRGQESAASEIVFEVVGGGGQERHIVPAVG